MNKELPMVIRNMLAQESVRTYHQIWHFVRRRSNWEGLSSADKQYFIDRGWEPPAFEDEPGAGLDFLFMHREMINMVNRHLQMHPDPNYTKVEGWDPIPFDPNDDKWPVPEWPEAPTPFITAKSNVAAEHYEGLVTNLFRNSEYLKSVTLDEVGEEMEFSIHGWMHLRWSSAPIVEDIFSTNDPSNDFLGHPYCSHVNNTFWKLHGFIDDTITKWENANGTVADFSNAWDGPSESYLPDMKHSADPELLMKLNVKKADKWDIMTWKVPILEGVNEKEEVIRQIDKPKL